MQECERLAIEIFPVLGEPSAASEPCEGAFDHPSSRENFEAFRPIGALDDFGCQMRQGLSLAGAELLSPITCIGEKYLQKWIQAEQRREHENAAVTILDAGLMHDGVHQQALRIDENVPLLALDLLAGIVTGGIDRSPPFSALFTLWLSMMQALGLASREAASRHFT